MLDPHGKTAPSSLGSPPIGSEVGQVGTLKVQALQSPAAPRTLPQEVGLWGHCIFKL